jgi:hypothetical protein
MDDIELIITTIEDDSKTSCRDRIKKELKDIQQAIHSSCAVSTMPSSIENIELGDEPTQLRRLAYATEA